MNRRIKIFRKLEEDFEAYYRMFLEMKGRKKQLSYTYLFKEKKVTKNTNILSLGAGGGGGGWCKLFSDIRLSRDVLEHDTHE